MKVSNNPKKVKMWVSNVRYPNKEKAQKYVGKCRTLNDGSKEVLLTVEEALRKWTQGYTIAPAEYDSSYETMNKDSWKSQQVFGIDIDEMMTPQEALNKCKEANIHPAGIYTSFNHTEENPRFRVIFQLDQVITSYEEAEDVTHRLAGIFMKDGKSVVDPQTLDPTRIFYGGKSLVHMNPDAVVKLSDLKKIEPAKEFHKENKSKNGRGSIKQEASEGGYHLNTPEVACIKAKDVSSLKAILQSKHLKNGENPWKYWTEAFSSKGGTITLYQYQYKDYCSSFTQSDLNPEISRSLSDSEKLTRNVPLHLLIGVDIYQKFQCLFHDDENPSAVVYVDKHERTRYHCNGCGLNLDAIDVVEKLTGYGYSEALSFVAEVFGIQLESDWQLKMQSYLIRELRYMKSDAFKEKYPKLYWYLEQSKAWPALFGMIYYCLEHMQDRALAVDNRPSFFVSLSKLSAFMQKTMGESEGFSKTRLNKKIKLLALLGLINYMDDGEIRKSYLEKAKTIQVKNQHEFRTNFFAIPEYGHALFSRAEEKIQELRGNYFRKSGAITRERIARGAGIEEADKLYVQSKDSGFSKKVEAFAEKMKPLVKEAVDRDGYFYEPHILSQIKGYRKEVKAEYSKDVLPSIIKELGLTKVKVNKKWRSLLNIPEIIKSNSIIFVKE